MESGTAKIEVSQNWQTRWHIIEVPGLSTGDIRNDIAFTIPKDFKLCTQALLVASTSGIAAEGFQIGFLTLHFNNKKRNPLQYPVRSKKVPLQRRKNGIISLSEPLEGGTRVQGYYHASGTVATQPYVLKIYIGGKHVSPPGQDKPGLPSIVKHKNDARSMETDT